MRNVRKKQKPKAKSCIKFISQAQTELQDGVGVRVQVRLLRCSPLSTASTRTGTRSGTQWATHAATNDNDVRHTNMHQHQCECQAEEKEGVGGEGKEGEQWVTWEQLHCGGGGQAFGSAIEL